VRTLQQWDQKGTNKCPEVNDHEAKPFSEEVLFLKQKQKSATKKPFMILSTWASRTQYQPARSPGSPDIPWPELPT
jgi:hypothetical protein